MKTDTYGSPEAKLFAMEALTAAFLERGIDKIYVKKLAPNDNSKNQPYFGSHLTDLNFIPTGEISESVSVSNKKNDEKGIIYQAPVDWVWFDSSNQTYPAPNTKLIYYPQYPEVRFSGFLRGCSVNLSEWMAPKKAGGQKVDGWLLAS